MSNDTPEYIAVPVVDNFNDQNIVGEMRILKSALPPTPDYVFVLAYMAEMGDDFEPGTVPTRPYKGSYALNAIAIQNDQDYLKYLQQIGVARRS